MFETQKDDLPELQKLRAAAELQRSYLYARDAKGGVMQIYADEIHARKMAQIDRDHIAGVQAILQKAEEDKSQALELSERANADPTAWLSAEELAHAQARAAFMAEDLAGADAETWRRRMTDAVDSGDRVAAWLLMRMAPGVGDLAENSLEERRRYVAARDALARAVVPEDIRTAQERSRKQLLDAERRRVASKWELHQLGGSQSAFSPW